MIGEIVEHAALEIRDKNETLIMIKESVKGQNGEASDHCSYANTGRFAWDSKAIRNTGTGWLPEEMTSDDWKPCWAAWTLVTAGSHDDVSLAVMQFDRRRFPPQPGHDLLSMNTWDAIHPVGNPNPQIHFDNCREFLLQAREEWVMREIDSVADLGIEMVTIGAGWAGEDSRKWLGKRPAKTMKLHEGDSILSKPASQ